MFKKGIFLKGLLTAILVAGAALFLQGQASLFLRGALQKPSGKPIDDGFHSLTFKLYEVEEGGTAIWTEIQPQVMVLNGFYETSLGKFVPLAMPFNKIYYLETAVDGGEELAPRARLGTSPYAISVTGKENVFPAGGPAGIGTLSPDSSVLSLHLKNAQGNGTLIVEGSQRAEIQLKKTGSTTTAGITFDSSRISISRLNIEVKNNLDLPNGIAIQYNGLADWRLVDRDDFSTGNDGWACVANWDSSATRTFERISPNTPFSKAFFLRPNQNGNDVLKKKFDLTGIPHSMIRVVFTYHFLDSWDDEGAFAAFASQNLPFTGSGQQNGFFHIGWRNQSPNAFNVADAFGILTGYYECFSSVTDAAVQGEMTAWHSGNDFWLFFGAMLNGTSCNESYGIGNIEIWVR